MDNNGSLSLFQAGGINIGNVQNQEEAEDLEDQKRRQEEIQNLLMVAMDEFNYDDQSTVNSSTNVSVDEAYRNQSDVEQKYKEANFDDQLKILYEVRVREVKSLTDEVENLKKELLQQKELCTKTGILLEAEKDKAQMSHKQSQALLVGKTEEITRLQQELSNVQLTIKNLEETVKSLNEENDGFKHSNNELMGRLNLLHNGLTTNTISDRQLLEKHQSELAQLNYILDNTNMKLHRKEKECKEFEQQLRETINQKDHLVADKCSVITKLTGSLEAAQEQCHDLLQIIEKVSQENRSLKLSVSTEMTDSIRNMGLADKTEIIKAMQREVEKSHDAQMKQQFEFDKLQKSYFQLSENYSLAENQLEQHKINQTSLATKNKALQDELTSRDDKIRKLKTQLADYKNVQAEKTACEKKIMVLEEAIKDLETGGTKETSVQVSRFSDTLNEIEKEENVKLRKELKDAYLDLDVLKERLFEAEEHVTKLTMTISLEKERDNLIKALQEKATQFEKIIKERQSKPELFSIGVNTESFQDSGDVLRAKYEGELVQKEIQLRVELKQLFDEKVAKIEREFSKKISQQKQEDCKSCSELICLLKQHKSLLNDQLKEVNSLKQQRQQDREAIATLLEQWSSKFLMIENEKQELVDNYVTIKCHCNDIALQLKTRDAGDAKLYDVIKRECEGTIKLWNKHTIEAIEKYTLAQRNRIVQTMKRIENCSKGVDREVSGIEMQFLKKKKSLMYRDKI